MDVKLPTFGEARLPPLSDTALDLIVIGLEIANQGAAKSMACELQQRRKESK